MTDKPASASPWVSPCASLQELDKRISELKTVQFWLDQNAKVLQATITALEVQRIGVAALSGMHADSVGPAPNAPYPAPQLAGLFQPRAQGMDPMQWWGTLTQQFAQLAGDALAHASISTDAAPPAFGQAKPAAHRTANQSGSGPAKSRRKPVGRSQG